MDTTPDTDAIGVYPLEYRTWRLGEVAPLGTDPLPLARVLAVAGRRRLRISAPEGSAVAGGPCAGGHVVELETGDEPLPIMVPPEAVPLLEPHMERGAYEDLLTRTPALRANGR